jgi:hypothetical protein
MKTRSIPSEPERGMRDMQLLVRVHGSHYAINFFWMRPNQSSNAIRVLVGGGNGKTATGMEVILYVH